MNNEHKIRIIKVQSGFSFPELIVVVMLIGIIAGITGSMFNWGVDMFDFVTQRKDVLQASRFGMEIMVKDLRAIKSSNDIPTADSSSISFYNSRDEFISFSFVNGVLLRNSQPLIGDLTTCKFTYFDVNDNDLGTTVTDPSLIWQIDISINATINNNPFHVQSSVIPRSF